MSPFVVLAGWAWLHSLSAYDPSAEIAHLKELCSECVLCVCVCVWQEKRIALCFDSFREWFSFSALNGFYTTSQVFVLTTSFVDLFLLPSLPPSLYGQPSLR